MNTEFLNWGNLEARASWLPVWATSYRTWPLGSSRTLRLVLVLLGLVSASPQARAQAGGPPAGAAVEQPRTAAARRFERGMLARAVFAGIELDSVQRVKAKVEVERMRAAWQPIFARQVPGRAMSAEDRAALHRIGESYNAAIRSILTLEQRNRLDANLVALHLKTASRRSGASKGGAQ